MLPGLGAVAGQTIPPPASGAPLLDPLPPLEDPPLEVPLIEPLEAPLAAPLEAPLRAPLESPLAAPLADPLFADPLEAPLPLAPASMAKEKASPPHPASGRAPSAATIHEVRNKVIPYSPKFISWIAAAERARPHLTPLGAIVEN
jgi:hypothetical protein